MRPERGDIIVRLPVTFDYKGGRGASKQTRVVTGLVIVVLTIIAMLVMLMGVKAWYIKVTGVVVILVICNYALRFLVLNEWRLRKAMNKMEEQEHKLNGADYWDIFDIDRKYPHFCHYKGGLTGIFVRFEKGLVTGKDSLAYFDHQKEVGDAYQLAGKLGVGLAHIDYMESVGGDSRIRALNGVVRQCENSGLAKVLGSIYHHLDTEMSRSYLDYDVYLFYSSGALSKLWEDTQKVIGVLQGADYANYRVLDANGVNQLGRALGFNGLNSMRLCNQIVAGGIMGLVPISIERNGKVEKLNLTQAELEQQALKERERLLQESLERAEEKRGNKRVLSNKVLDKKAKISENETIDIFE